MCVRQGIGVRSALTAMSLIVGACWLASPRAAADVARRSSPSERLLTIRSLTNADVEFGGTPLGLWPTLSDVARRYAETVDERLAAELLDALDDRNRDIVAHVLLTELELHRRASVRIDAAEYNGLRIALLADGSTEFHAADRAQLSSRWEAVYAKARRAQ